MSDDPLEQFQQYNTVKVRAVLVYPEDDPAHVVQAGILDPIRIPIRIVRRGGEPQATGSQNLEKPIKS